MNNPMKKGLVLTLALAMTASASLPAFAAAPAVTTAAPVVAENVLSNQASVKGKAQSYFNNYVAANVSAASFLDRVASNEKLTVLDIRDAVDYEKGHVKEAINVPYGQDVVKALEKIPNDRPVMVYCYSGQTASQTAALLRMAGKDAYNVSGGWNNGISKAEKIGQMTTTKEYKFRSGDYSVSYSMIKAIENYYELALKNGKFNISNTVAQSMIEKDEVFLLDVRSKDDHTKSWIKGVDMNIPFGEDMDDSFYKLPKDKKILVQCYSGQTASQTMTVLRMLGYDAYTLSGGTNGWKSANLPMQSITAQQFVNIKVADYFANLPANKNQVSAAAFLEAAKTPNDICIIDIRDKVDYEKGHIRSAVNIPYGEIAANLDKIPNDRTVYVHCYSGQTASQTVMLLNLAGKKAVNVSGGWNNGISKEKAHKELKTTGNYVLKDKTYAVDTDIAKAIEGYYDSIAKEATNKKGNISVANVKKIVDAKDANYQVVDLRSAADFKKGHIDGAMNLPYGKGMNELFNTLPKNKTLILHCYSGQTASQTMAALRVMGYKAYNVSGGMNNGWLAAGNELVK